MSQAKVDRYKRDKKNRKKIIAREKRNWFLTKVSLVCVGALIVFWIGWSSYKVISESSDTDTTLETTAYTIDLSAIDDYISGLEED